MSNHKVLPSKKQNKGSIHSVMKSVRNKHEKTPIKYSTKRASTSERTGLVKR